MNAFVIILSLLVLGTVITVVVLIVKKDNEKTKTSSRVPQLPQPSPSQQKKLQEKNNESPQRYLEPTTFEVGVMPSNCGKDAYKSSNLCNDTVLYPINALDVSYGSVMPEKCGCMEFIQPP